MSERMVNEMYSKEQNDVSPFARPRFHSGVYDSGLA